MAESREMAGLARVGAFFRLDIFIASGFLVMRGGRRFAGGRVVVLVLVVASDFFCSCIFFM